MIKCPKCKSDYSQQGYYFCPMDGHKLFRSGMVISDETFKEYDELCISAGNPNRRFLQCENCNKTVDVNEDSGHHLGCDFVYGRRGWRQLGAYDG